MGDLAGGLTEKAAEEAGKLLPQVYQDAVQPAAKEIGTALGRAVRIALSPVRGFAWTWERAEAWLEEAVSNRLAEQKVPPENVITPAPQLTAGVVRGVQAAGPESDPTLRDLFANLLATAMQADRFARAHPAFAEILSQMTPDEAKILRVVARRIPSPVVITADVLVVEGVLGIVVEFTSSAAVLVNEIDFNHPELLESYLDNLVRLGLIRLEIDQFDHHHALAVAPNPSKHEQERRDRWLGYREYLGDYSDVARQARDEFERRSREHPISARDAKRPGIGMRVAWPTSFGEQLLRASVPPSEFRLPATMDIGESNLTEANSGNAARSLED